MRKRTEKITPALLIVTVACVSIAFAIYRLSSPGGRLEPERQLPPLEIVTGTEYSISDPYFMGFMHPDGTGFTTRQVVVWYDRLGITQPFIRQINSFYTWSPDGEYLAAEISSRWSPAMGFPILISTTGDILICPEGSVPVSSIASRTWVVSVTQVLTTAESEYAPTQAVLVEMSTCETSPFLVGQQPLDGGILEVTLSSQEWVAAEYDEGIRLFTPDGEQMALIPDAHYPTWSRDGNWLAYITECEFQDGTCRSISQSPTWPPDSSGNWSPPIIVPCGLWIARNDGSGSQELDEGACRPSPPSWSPDGEWVIYGLHEAPYGIYTINVETGERIQISEGTRSPAWRWGWGDENGD